MTQLKRVVEPFGEVNVHPAAGGKTRVTATILMEPHKEGAQTGIALDGSGSMAKLYGVGEEPGFLASLFGMKNETHNDVTPVAQNLRLPGAQDRRRRRHHLHLLGDRPSRRPDRDRRRPDRRPGREARLRPAARLRHWDAAPPRR